MEFLENLDFFGTEYSFFINLRKKFYNKFGGISTIITLLTCLGVFFFMSKNDFALKKPKSIYNYETSDGYKKFKFGEQKILIPWRITTYEKTLANYENIIYPYIYYNKIKFGKEDEAKKIQLNSILCNQTDINSYPELISINFDPSSIFCINTDGLDLGEINEEAYFIKFEITLCKNGIEYDELNENCTSIEKLHEAMGNTSWSIEFYFPEFEFHPNDHLNPFRGIYKNHIIYLSKYTYKLENVYFKENIVSDNDNFFSSVRRNSSYYGYYKNDWSTYLLAKNDILKDGTNSRIYELNLRLALGAQVYMRDYKNLFDIIANIWPIISFVYYFIKLIVNEIKISLINYNLCKYVFIYLKNNENEMRISPIHFNKILKSDESININYNHLIEKNSILRRNNNNLSQMNINSNYCIINSYTDNQNIRPLENMNKINKTLMAKNNSQFVNKLNINTNKNVVLKRKNNSSINQNESTFKLRYFLCAEFFDIFLLKAFLKKMPLSFRKLSDNMRQVMDVSTYIKSIIKLNMIINLGLPDEARKLIKKGRSINENLI